MPDKPKQWPLKKIHSSIRSKNDKHFTATFFFMMHFVDVYLKVQKNSSVVVEIVTRQFYRLSVEVVGQTV